MRDMCATTFDLPAILADHKLWCDGCKDGKRAILNDADLNGADLSYTNLSGASLHGASLHDASLNGANMSGADLRGANLHGADLHGAIGYVCLGTDKRGYHFRATRHEAGWMISAGCRWFTVAEAVKHWTTRDNKDALARVAILQSHMEDA
jgi:hypothetical protein